MQFLFFDIPDGESLGDFLRDISCHGYISPQAIGTLLQESLSTNDYYIRTYPVKSGEGKFFLNGLKITDIKNLLFSSSIEIVKGKHIINKESMIFKHKS